VVTLAPDKPFLRAALHDWESRALRFYHETYRLDFLAALDCKKESLWARPRYPLFLLKKPAILANKLLWGFPKPRDEPFEQAVLKYKALLKVE
jgi:hypothetical protein